MTTDGYDRLHGAPRPLDRARLAVPAPDAAAGLLGMLVVRERDDESRIVARIVETEAYREDDPASHSSAGRTARTEPMFRRPGTSYVYRSYGIHWCWNVSVEEEGLGAAALIRAAVVLEGSQSVRERRPVGAKDAELLRGPGRLTSGLDIDAPRHDRVDVVAGEAGLWLADDGWRPAPASVRSGPRVGVRLAADVPWRFHLVGPAAVSPYRRSPRAAVPASDPDAWDASPPRSTA